MPKRQLKIAFICTGSSGLSFYRAFQPAMAIKKMGLAEVSVLFYRPQDTMGQPWEVDFLNNPAIPDAIESHFQWADVVVCMKLCMPHTLEHIVNCARRYGKCLITEIDDAIFSTSYYNSAVNYHRPGDFLTQVFANQLQMSDGVIVSTPYLKNYYEKYHKSVHVVENAIDLSLWRPITPPRRPEVNLGWVGGASHNEDLGLIKEAVFKVLERDGVGFNCLHGTPDFFKGHKKIRWNTTFKAINKYPKWVSKAGFDIGLAPLMDNAFNRSKSNLRWLEMSAMGIPTVASPLNHFKETIEHGVTGFLANSTEEWITHLLRLIDEPALRENVGKNARNEVKEKWNPKLLGRKMLTTIKEIHHAVVNPIRLGNAYRAAGGRPVEQYLA